VVSERDETTDGIKARYFASFVFEMIFIRVYRTEILLKKSLSEKVRKNL